VRLPTPWFTLNEVACVVVQESFDDCPLCMNAGAAVRVQVGFDGGGGDVTLIVAPQGGGDVTLIVAPQVV